MHTCISVNSKLIPSRRWVSLPNGSCPIFITVIVWTAQHRQFTRRLGLWIEVILFHTSDTPEQKPLLVHDWYYFIQAKIYNSHIWKQDKNHFCWVFCTAGLVGLLNILLFGLIALPHNIFCEVCGPDSVQRVTTRIVLEYTYQFGVFPWTEDVMIVASSIRRLSSKLNIKTLTS